MVNNTKKAAPKKHLPEILTVTLARPPLPFFGGRCVTRHTHFISGLMDVCMCFVVCWLCVDFLFAFVESHVSRMARKGGRGWGCGTLLTCVDFFCGKLSNFETVIEFDFYQVFSVV